MQEFLKNVMQAAVNTESPNLLRNIYITPKKLTVEAHLPIFGGSTFTTANFPPVGNLLALQNVLMSQEVLQPLTSRKLGSLEGIYVAEGLGGAATANHIAQGVSGAYPSTPLRLHEVGSVADDFELPQQEGYRLGSAPGVSAQEFSHAGNILSQGSTHRVLPWFEVLSLEPEHYTQDVEGGALYKILKASSQHWNERLAEQLLQGDEGTAKDAESEELSQDDVSEDDAEQDSDQDVLTDEDVQELSELQKSVREFYANAARGVVVEIAQNYNSIFKSGYEILHPEGVVSRSLVTGQGTLSRIVNGQLQEGKPQQVVQNLYTEVYERMGLTEVPVRSIADIANILVSGRLADGSRVDNIPDISQDDNKVGILSAGVKPIFPFKMLEYAFGQKQTSSSLNDGDLKVYQGHSSKNNWDDYCNHEVKDSLYNAILHTVEVSLKNANLLERFYSPEAQDIVSNITETFRKAFLTCVLISKLDTNAQGELVSLKVRVLDPYNALPRKRNILEDILRKSFGDVRTLDNVEVFDPRAKGSFVEYTLELDALLANANPLFSYHAAEVIIEQGDDITFDSMVFGKGLDDSILRNGSSSINFRNKIVHLACAGSRAGKGVATFSFMGGAIISRKALFYNDNKPDMASAVAYLSKGRAFVINGSSLSSADGSDMFGQYREGTNFVGATHTYMPEWLKGFFKFETAQKATIKHYGDFVYLKSMIFVLGIIAARALLSGQDGDVSAQNREKYERLGGARGVTAIFDELGIASTGLSRLLNDEIKSKGANTNYARDYKKALDEDNIDSFLESYKDTVPSRESYFITYWLDSLKESFRYMDRLNRADLHNGESAVSDIFVLTQTPPPVLKLPEIEELFPERTKTRAFMKGVENPSAIIGALPFMFPSDAFFGYGNGSNFLGQNNKGSKASQYLNKVSRHFGYVPTYDAGTVAAAETVRLGNSEGVTYYKPFLTFAKSSIEDYPSRNANKFMKSAGVNVEDVIARNSHPDNPKDYHPAVGIQGYLNLCGMSDQEIEDSLALSGDIANYVVQKMGYKGSWQEFMYDFRPEWSIFSIQNVAEAVVSDIPLQSTVATRMPDFVVVYGDSDTFMEDTPLNAEKADEGLQIVPGQGRGDISEGVTDDLISFDTIDFSDDVNPDSDSTVPATENTALAEDLGDEDSEPWDSEDVTTQKIPQVTSPQQEVPSLASAAPSVPEEPPVVSQLREQIAALQQQVQQLLAAREVTPQQLQTEGSALPPEFAVANVGGRVDGDKYEPLNAFGEPAGLFDSGTQVHMRDFDENTPVNREGAIMLQQHITRGIFAQGAVRQISVQDDLIYVNRRLYHPVFRKSYLENVPDEYFRELLIDSRVAQLVDWNIVSVMGNTVEYLSLPDEDFARRYFSVRMGWGGRLNLGDVFARFKSLKACSVGTYVFTRDNFENTIRQMESGFYEPSRAQLVSDSISSWMTRSRRSVFARASEARQSDDYSSFQRIWRVGAYSGLGVALATGSVVKNTASGTWRALGDRMRKFSTNLSKL